MSPKHKASSVPPNHRLSSVILSKELYSIWTSLEKINLQLFFYIIPQISLNKLIENFMGKGLPHKNNADSLIKIIMIIAILITVTLGSSRLLSRSIL